MTEVTSLDKLERDLNIVESESEDGDEIDDYLEGFTPMGVVYRQDEPRVFKPTAKPVKL